MITLTCRVCKAEYTVSLTRPQFNNVINGVQSKIILYDPLEVQLVQTELCCKCWEAFVSDDPDDNGD